MIVYALLAVLPWPSGTRTATQQPARLVAERSVGAAAARRLWLVFWGSLAYLAVQPSNTTSQGLHNVLSQMAFAQPGWLAWIEQHAAGLVAHRGLSFAVTLAILLAAIAVGVFLPTPVARGSIVLAFALAVIIWVVGEALGDIFSGQATDPNSGPLLALFALAYWPRSDQADHRYD